MKRIISLLSVLVVVSMPVYSQNTKLLFQKCYSDTEINADLLFSAESYDKKGLAIVSLVTEKSTHYPIYHGQYDIGVVKLDNNGEIKWRRCYGGSEDDVAVSISPTSDNGFIICARSYSSDGDITNNHGEQDIWVVKLDEDGNIQWQKSYGGKDNEFANSILPVRGNNGYYLNGLSFSKDGDVNRNNNSGYFWLVKLSEEGDIQRQYFLDSKLSSYGVLSAVGNKTVFAYCMTNLDDPGDIEIIDLDHNGNILNRKCLGFRGIYSPFQIVKSKDDNYFIYGNLHIKHQDRQSEEDWSWICKIDSNSNLLWKKNIDLNVSYNSINGISIFNGYLVHNLLLSKNTYSIFKESHGNSLPLVSLSGGWRFTPLYFLPGTGTEFSILGKSTLPRFQKNGFPAIYSVWLAKFSLDIDWFNQKTTNDTIYLDRLLCQSDIDTTGANLLSGFKIDDSLSRSGNISKSLSLTPMDTTYKSEYIEDQKITEKQCLQFEKYNKKFIELYRSERGTDEMKYDLKDIIDVVENLKIRDSGLNGLTINDLNNYLCNFNYLIKKYKKVRKKMNDSVYWYNYHGLIYNTNQILKLYKRIQIEKSESGMIYSKKKVDYASLNNDVLDFHPSLHVFTHIPQQSLVEVQSWSEKQMVENYAVKWQSPGFMKPEASGFFTGSTTCRKYLANGAIYDFWLYAVDRRKIKSNPFQTTLDEEDTDKCDGMPCQIIKLDVLK